MATTGRSVIDPLRRPDGGILEAMPRASPDSESPVANHSQRLVVQSSDTPNALTLDTV